MAFLQVPFGGAGRLTRSFRWTGALHNLPHHYYAGFTHLWLLGEGASSGLDRFQNVSEQAGLDLASWLHFERLGIEMRPGAIISRPLGSGSNDPSSQRSA